jgi:hypothetical protein
MVDDFIYLYETELETSCNCSKWGGEGAEGERRWGQCDYCARQV